jgi:hypothetical protein
MEGPSEPPRTEVIRWLRINLGVTMTIIGIVSGIGGGLVTGTWRVAAWDNRVTSLEVAHLDMARQIAKIQVVIDSDIDRRVTAVSDLASMSQRLSVLEDRLRFIGEYVHDAMMPHPAQATRR